MVKYKDFILSLCVFIPTIFMPAPNLGLSVESSEITTGMAFFVQYWIVTIE